MKIVVSLAAILLWTPSAICQSVPTYFLNSTVLISHPAPCRPPQQPGVLCTERGSGFLIFYVTERSEQPPRTTGQVLLVTNKHVLPPEGSPAAITIRVAMRKEGKVDVEKFNLDVVGRDGHYAEAVERHPDDSVDVAVVDVNRELAKYMPEGRVPAFLETQEGKLETVHSDYLIPRSELSGALIGIGSEVYLLGYPDGMYDPHSASPLLRMGVIATEPTRDYGFDERLQQTYGLPAILRGFLIDANVFPGSSGSMIIRRPNSVSNIHGGKVSIPYVVGIVAKSVPIEDYGHLQRMGLGVVYSADTIREVCDAYLRRIKAIK